MKNVLTIVALITISFSSHASLDPVGVSGSEISAIALDNAVLEKVTELNAEKIESITNIGEAKYIVSANGCGFEVEVQYITPKEIDGFPSYPEISGVKIGETNCSVN